MSTLLRALLTALLYFVAARSSVELQDLVGLGAIYWPGAGVTVTALLVSPRRAWTAILIAVGLAEVGNDLVTGFGLVPSMWWAAANMAEPLLAAWLIQRWRADGFGSVRGVALFALAAFLAPVVGGAMGSIGTTGTVSSLPYAVTAGQWIVGDGLGILTVVPFGLVVARRLSARPLGTPEGVVAVAAVLLATVVVFLLEGPNGVVAGDYLVLLPLVWAAVRLGVAGAAVSLFLLSQIANGFHAAGRGPFAGSELSYIQGSAQLQMFLATVGIAALLLASRTVESERYQGLAAAREQLIASVSHELRTPLTPILGFSETMLRHDGVDSQTRQAAEVIHRNARHLSELVDDLLRTSRARRGALPVDPEAVAVGLFIDEMLQGRAEDNIEVHVDSEVAVWVDRTHLTQIVTNLLDNAVRYARPPVRIEVASEAQACRLSVIDHGDGVPEWFVSELFDDFAQASRGDGRSGGGLGLGLPIARMLARANDGDLTYADEDVGARFTLRLPTSGADQISMIVPTSTMRSRGRRK